MSKAFARAERIGCEAMQIFTRNQQQWAARPLDAAEIERWRELAAASQVRPVVAHASYLINLASPDPELWQRSIAAFVDELERAETLGLLGVVLHPGSHMGEGEDWGIERIAAALDRCHQRTEGYTALALLETTAGSGHHMGHRFEHLGGIRACCAAPQRVAVCFDTCHVLAAGYDFRTPQGYAETLAAFDQAVGLELLACFHLNDSKHEAGSRKDRHTHIGQGHVGLDAFGYLLNDARFAGKPMLLETPKGDDMQEDVENLAVLRGLLA